MKEPMGNFWNQEAVDQLFRDMAGGFRPAGPEELFISASVLLFIVLTYYGVSRLKNQRLAQRREQIARSVFAKETAAKKLLPSELSLGMRLGYAGKDEGRISRSAADLPPDSRLETAAEREALH